MWPKRYTGLTIYHWLLMVQICACDRNTGWSVPVRLNGYQSYSIRVGSRAAPDAFCRTMTVPDTARSGLPRVFLFSKLNKTSFEYSDQENNILDNENTSCSGWPSVLPFSNGVITKKIVYLTETTWLALNFDCLAMRWAQNAFRLFLGKSLNSDWFVGI